MKKVILVTFITLSTSTLIFLNGSPIPWQKMYSALNGDQIGSRQKIMLLRKRNDFALEKVNRRGNLFYGNSQNYFLIRDYAKKSNEYFILWSLPLFNNLDFLGHSKAIEGFQKKRVIIFTSAFFFVDHNTPDRINYYPRVNLKTHVFIAKTLFKTYRSYIALKYYFEFLYNQIFSPLRYKYAFNGYLHSLISNQALPLEKKSDKSLELKNLNFDNGAKEEILKRFREIIPAEVPIYLVDGVFKRHPDDIEYRKFIDKLRDLNLPNFYFIQNSKTRSFQLKKSDFRDEHHPKFDKGAIYTRGLMEVINELELNER